MSEKKWQKRFFILKDQEIFYFKKEPTKDSKGMSVESAKGVIYLTQAKLSKSNDHTIHNGFEITPSIVENAINYQRTFVLKASSKEEMEIWYDKILNCLKLHEQTIKKSKPQMVSNLKLNENNTDKIENNEKIKIVQITETKIEDDDINKEEVIDSKKKRKNRKKDLLKVGMGMNDSTKSNQEPKKSEDNDNDQNQVNVEVKENEHEKEIIVNEKKEDPKDNKELDSVIEDNDEDVRLIDGGKKKKGCCDGCVIL